MAVTKSQVQRFTALFDGYTKAFGKFQIERTNERGKKEGRAYTVREPLTADHYTQHLNGTLGIGVIPLGDDQLVRFAAIDIDDYSEDVIDFERKVSERGLPLVICRSKSGGVHAYLFLKEAVEAAQVRAKLELYAAQLGHGGCEIFPKQSSRVNEQDTGNWINLPYFNAADTDRYAVHDGAALSFAAFLDHAEACAAPPDIFAASTSIDPKKGPFSDGPPCLQHLHAQGGFLSGARNNGMFNVAVYLRKRYAENWGDKLAEYNAIMSRPMLGHSEINSVAKSASRKEYAYRCKEPPINAFCSRGECMRRKYGVGDTGATLDVQSVTRYTTGRALDRVYWGLEVNGARILCTNEELYNRDSFNRKCLATAGTLPVQVPQGRWVTLLGDIVKEANVVDLPEESGASGMIWAHVEEFCSQKAQAKELSEVWLDKPFFDPFDGRVYFTMKALKQYLMQRRVSVGDGHDLYYLLREHGGEGGVRSVGGKNIRLWSIVKPEPPAPEKRQEAAMTTEQEPF